MRQLLKPAIACLTLGLTLVPSFSTAQSGKDYLFLPAADVDKRLGKKIVLIAGDEEYRSEESCPMLGKILSQHHGFDCVVLFSVDPEKGFIDPNFQTNTPGLAHLKDADLMIIGTRFRQLPDKQAAHIANFLNAGKPVIGFRTATHAFTGKGKSGNFAWSNFGPQILGEGWVAHHGKHKSEGCRGVVVGENALHPVLNSVYDVFGPSDVYTIKAVTPENATILMRGAVTQTMEPDSPILKDDPRNKPMQPMAWIRDYWSPNGKVKGKAFCTTMGASNDFTNEDLRRLVVNAAFHLTGEKVPQNANVSYVDPFEATMFGLIKEPGYYAKLNLQADSYALGKSTATGLPVAKPKKSVKEAEPTQKKTATPPKKVEASKKDAPAKKKAEAAAKKEAPAAEKNTAPKAEAAANKSNDAKKEVKPAPAPSKKAPAPAAEKKEEAPKEKAKPAEATKTGGRGVNK